MQTAVNKTTDLPVKLIVSSVFSDVFTFMVTLNDVLYQEK